MKILIPVINYQFLTGAEMYVYELSRVLALRGHEVTVAAPTAKGEIARRTRMNGVRVWNFREYDNETFDIIHTQESIPTEWAMMQWPDVPKVATIHSQWPCEKPVVTEDIHTYICVRPEVREAAINLYEIPAERTTVIYNGIDMDRFKPNPTQPERRHIIFPGTIDTLRMAAHIDLINWSVREDFDVTIIGKKWSPHLDEQMPPNVKIITEENWDIQELYATATETAGIVLGRTTIEGWAMGIPGWIYDVDLAGRIVSVKGYPPPAPDIMIVFNVEYMVDQLESLYASAIRERSHANLV